MINYCKQCGLPFRKLTKKHLYCNKCKSCGINYYKKNPILKKTCPVCGDHFKTNLTKKVYCSAICRNKADDRSGKKHKLVCPNCGITFETSKKNKVYCTTYCYEEHKAKEAKRDYILSKHGKEQDNKS